MMLQRGAHVGHPQWLAQRHVAGGGSCSGHLDRARRSRLFLQRGLRPALRSPGHNPHSFTLSRFTLQLFQRHEPGREQTDVLAAYAGEAEPSAAIVGASAKQLFETAVHSLDTFEPRAPASIDDEHLYDSFEEQREGVALHTTVNKTNYEVLRLDDGGKVRRLHVKRRDLLREHQLQPRDLRRVDPAIDFTKTSPSITIKESVLLLNLGGIRAIVTADKSLLFEPNSANTRKLLDTIVPRLQTAAGQRAAAVRAAAAGAAAAAAAAGGPLGGAYYGSGGGGPGPAALRGRPMPFELEVLEGVLTVATGRLDAEVLSVTRRVSALLTRLPREINPVNLEELRRIKQALVELENKADAIREVLEQLMDDEDEMRELNLSSRPRREERRRQRERDRLERELERAREELEKGRSSQELQPSDSAGASLSAASPLHHSSGSRGGSAAGSSGSSGASSSRRRNGNGRDGGAGGGVVTSRQQRLAQLYAKHGTREQRRLAGSNGNGSAGNGSGSGEEWRYLIDGGDDGSPASSRDVGERQKGRDDPEEDYQEAQDALEEMAEQEEEEQEIEEVEDLLEYYLQRSTGIQSEAERLLQGARDLEESIGVSLSARRYEVGRLELMLSMGSFAAALGAMIAGIFGMNMRSTLENSTAGFWATTTGICVLCLVVFIAIYRYTQQRRIL